MKSNNANRWFLLAGCLGVVSVISWVVFGLYVSRLSSDGVGIGLNAVIAIAFTIAAIGFFNQWRKGKDKADE